MEGALKVQNRMRATFLWPNIYLIVGYLVYYKIRDYIAIMLQYFILFLYFC